MIVESFDGLRSEEWKNLIAPKQEDPRMLNSFNWEYINVYFTSSAVPLLEMRRE